MRERVPGGIVSTNDSERGTSIAQEDEEAERIAYGEFTKI